MDTFSQFMLGGAFLVMAALAFYVALVAVWVVGEGLKWLWGWWTFGDDGPPDDGFAV
jgi:hypothetical protein